MIIDVFDNSFRKEVLEASNKKKVVVDFWAGWCMPCKTIAPVFINIEKKFPFAKFVKVNVDKNPKISLKYDIVDVPCIKIFENEQILTGFVGFKKDEDLEKWLSKNLKK